MYFSLVFVFIIAVCGGVIGYIIFDLYMTSGNWHFKAKHFTSISTYRTEERAIKAGKSFAWSTEGYTPDDVTAVKNPYA